MSGDKKSFWQQTREFIPQVKHEVGKVTWPSRRETVMTTVVVFLFAIVVAIYLAFIVDNISFKIIEFILGLGA